MRLRYLLIGALVGSLVTIAGFTLGSVLWAGRVRGPNRHLCNGPMVCAVARVVTVEAYTLSEQRLLARALWKRKLIERGNRWCACGNTRIFHDVYHERPDWRLTAAIVRWEDIKEPVNPVVNGVTLQSEPGG